MSVINRKYIEKYSEANPDASVKDLLSFIESEDSKEISDRVDRAEKWYSELDGKCFATSFKKGSTIYLYKVPESWSDAPFMKTAVYTFTDSPVVGIGIKEDYIPRHWFKNPWVSYEDKSIEGTVNMEANTYLIPKDVFFKITSILTKNYNNMLEVRQCMIWNIHEYKKDSY